MPLKILNQNFHISIVHKMNKGYTEPKNLASLFLFSFQSGKNIEMQLRDLNSTETVWAKLPHKM